MTNIINPNSNITTRQELQQRIVQQSVFNTLVANRTHKQIDTPKGHLVRQYDPITGSLVGLKDMGKDVVNIGRAFVTGESNDHELGRMNDIGLKVGGLGIAAYLSAKANTKYGKGMEFAGLGLFLLAMKLWPTLAIDLPTQLKYGFNPRQKYIDSQGRKKEFFQDNQYQPWDLYTSEQINKIGDRMGVPKGMPDREEFIKKKMRTIALQDNTLWMATAGFATPLAAALGGSVVSPLLKNLIIKLDSKKTLKHVKDIDKHAGRIAKNPLFERTNTETLRQELIKLGSGKPEKSLFKNIAGMLNPLNTKQLKFEQYPSDHAVFKTLGNLNNVIADDVKALYAQISAQPANETNLLNSLKNLFRQYGVTDIDNITSLKALQNKMDIKNITPDGIISFIKSEAPLIDGHEDLIKGMFDNSAQVNKQFKAAVKADASALKDIKSRTSVLAKATNALAGNKTESVFTKSYLDTSKKFFKNVMGNNDTIFGIIKNKIFGYKEVNKIMENNNAAYGIMKDKMKNIATNDSGFEKFVKNTASNFISSDDALKTINEEAKKLSQVVEGLNLNGEYKNLKNALSLKQGGAIASAFGSMISLGQNNLDSTISRILTAIDFEKRVSNNSESLRGVSDTMIETCRKIIYTGTMSDIQNKNFLDHSLTDYKQIYQILFGSELDNSTTAAIRKLKDGRGDGLIERLKDFRSSVIATSNAANARNANLHQLPDAGANFTPEKDYIKVGESLVDNMVKSAKQIFNDRKWLKIFGTVGAVVLAGTLVAQTFFGKVKDEEYYLGNGGANAGK